MDHVAGVESHRSTDEQAELPDDTTFTPADRGTRTFAAILKTAGLQSLTARDTVDPTLAGTQANVLVEPAAPALFYLDAPASVASGVPFTVTLFVLDAYLNLVPGYCRAVDFASSDPDAVLPGKYAFTEEDQGFHTFLDEFTLFAAGPQSHSAADTGDLLLTGGAVIVVETGDSPGRSDNCSRPDGSMLWRLEEARVSAPRETAPVQSPSPSPALEAPQVTEVMLVDWPSSATPPEGPRFLRHSHLPDTVWAVFHRMCKTGRRKATHRAADGPLGACAKVASARQSIRPGPDEAESTCLSTCDTRPPSVTSAILLAQRVPEG